MPLSLGYVDLVFVTLKWAVPFMESTTRLLFCILWQTASSFKVDYCHPGCLNAVFHLPLNPRQIKLEKDTKNMNKWVTRDPKIKQNLWSFCPHKWFKKKVCPHFPLSQLFSSPCSPCVSPSHTFSFSLTRFLKFHSLRIWRNTVLWIFWFEEWTPVKRCLRKRNENN